MFKTENGNILFLILIAVALFAALSYAVTGSNRTTGNTVESEKSKLARGQVDSYMAMIETGKNKLALINNCSTIDYTIPKNQVAGDKSCHLFHPDGGNVVYRDIEQACNEGNILKELALGETCGLIMYAGESGGNRLYTTISDQGTDSYNNSTTNWFPTGATSTTDGLANTNTLLEASDIGAPYNAAQLCRTLGEKWYLPAQAELQELYDNRARLNIMQDGWYRTSTELTDRYAAVLRVSSGLFSTTTNKNASWVIIRCIRRD
jgi:hypothetical protein